MSEAKDPEQLLADALRAQAAFAPQASAPEQTAPTEADAALPAAYGLLSGAGEGSLERERAALDAAEAPTAYTPRPAEQTRQAPASAQLPAYWILLLAVLLGLAAGSVVGLLTLV